MTEELEEPDREVLPVAELAQVVTLAADGVLDLAKRAAELCYYLLLLFLHPPSVPEAMTLFERVRDGLDPDFDVRREIGRGGMGLVYEAVDRRLEQRVAVKVLRPELATARAVERFRREAKGLARVDHPRLLRVHRAGEADGLFYYVMEYAEGETLADRLDRGPLAPSERDALASDLLDGLAAIHRAGIVHRDIKPSNIFLHAGRARLGDFGVVSGTGDKAAHDITATGQFVGTPAYAAPEQQHGETTAASDVYATGLVLYEACTGVPWRERPEQPWRGVPRGLRRALKRALHTDPGRRPADGTAFRAEFVRAGRRARRRRIAWVGALVVVAVAGAVWLRAGPPSAPRGVADLAVLPFQLVGSAGDADLARDLWQLTTLNLQGLEGLKVIPPAQAARFGPLAAGPAADGSHDGLNAVSIARGTVVSWGDRLVLRLAVEDSTGRPLGEARVGGSPTGLYRTADSAALALVEILVPHLASSYRRLEAVHTDDFRALRAFLQGEDAFNSNAWSRAEDQYRAALDEDSTFALAKWRLWYVHNWRLAGEERIDLERLYREHADELGTVDAALLRARALPPGPARIDSLESVARRLGHSSYPWFLLGDEHYHRGPLAGGSLEEAARYLAEAAARDPDHAPAYEHGVMVLTRLGRREEALEALRQLQRTAAPPTPGEPLHIPTFLEQAVHERFLPEEALKTRDHLIDPTDPTLASSLMLVARMGLSFDVPEAQRALGVRLVEAGRGAATARVQGHRAQALALLVLGRPRAALGHLDSVAALGVPGAAIEAAEWRVLAPLLGVEGVPPTETELGRERLRDQAAAGSDVTGRAAWALAMDAWLRGDHEAAQHWRRTLEGLEQESEHWRLVPLLDAFSALAQGRYQRALSATDPILDDQYAPDQGYPFTRTALHIVRARALEAMGETAGAAAERAWADNQDVASQLDGPLQAVEVDWATSPYSDRRRARLALALADTAATCRLLDRIQWLWTEAEPALDSLRAADARRRAEVCA